MRTLCILSAAVAMTSASLVFADTAQVTELPGVAGATTVHAYGISNTPGTLLGERDQVVGVVTLDHGSGVTTVNAFGTVDPGATNLSDAGYWPATVPGPISGGALLSASNSFGYGMAAGIDGSVVGFKTKLNTGLIPFTHAMISVPTGSTWTTNDLHATVVAGIAGTKTSRAFAINANNTIVGEAGNASGVMTGFYATYNSGTDVWNAVSLPSLAGYTNALPTGVSNRGTVVGFVYANASNPSDSWSEAAMIASNGNIGGGVAHPRAVAWTGGGSPLDLGSIFASGTDSLATGISWNGDSGSPVEYVSGESITGGASHAVLFTLTGGGLAPTEAVTSLPQPAGVTASLAEAVNASGTAVGYMESSIGRRAFVYKGGQMIDLNTLLSPADQALWTLTDAGAINDQGIIAATGKSLADNSQQVFLLQIIQQGAPVTPEPASIGLIGLGGMAMVARRRRRA